jgi:hypothetical protein
VALALEDANEAGGDGLIVFDEKHAGLGHVPDGSGRGRAFAPR